MKNGDTRFKEQRTEISMPDSENRGVNETAGQYVMCCSIWYQSLFAICIVVRTHTNAC